MLYQLPIYFRRILLCLISSITSYFIYNYNKKRGLKIAIGTLMILFIPTVKGYMAIIDVQLITIGYLSRLPYLIAFSFLINVFNITALYPLIIDNN